MFVCFPVGYNLAGDLSAVHVGLRLRITLTPYAYDKPKFNIPQETSRRSRWYYTGHTNDYEIAYAPLDFDFAVVRSSTLSVHGLLTGLECLFIAGDASISHLYSTGQHVRRGITEVDGSLDHS